MEDHEFLSQILMNPKVFFENMWLGSLKQETNHQAYVIFIGDDTTQWYRDYYVTVIRIPNSPYSPTNLITYHKGFEFWTLFT